MADYSGMLAAVLRAARMVACSVLCWVEHLVLGWVEHLVLEQVDSMDDLKVEHWADLKVAETERE